MKELQCCHGEKRRTCSEFIVLQSISGDFVGYILQMLLHLGGKKKQEWYMLHTAFAHKEVTRLQCNSPDPGVKND